MDYQQTGRDAFKAVGGNDNITAINHCATRLRFRVKSTDNINLNEIEQIPGVLRALNANGELQVVIGPNVTTAYQAIEKEFTGSGDPAADSGEKKKWSEVFLGTISGIFAPIIPAITAAGMVKAVLALLKVFGVIDVDGMTYQILNFCADAAFYFMPIMLANSAAKMFQMSSGLAMMLAGMLLHPTFTSLVAAGDPITLFGLPIRAVSYSSTVIPVILIVFVASYVEKFANKILPDVIKYIFRPLLVMAVMIPLSLCALGPIGYMIGDGLAWCLDALNGLAPWLLPTVMGALTPILVMFGLHNGLIPFASTQLAAGGFENLMGPGMLASNISQGAASLAVAFKSKNKQTKQTAISTGFTALMGITEPAMYGITLKYKGVLPAVMFGGLCGGLFAGFSGLVRYSFGSPGLATLPVFIGDDPSNLLKALATAAIGFVVTFAATMFVKLEEEPDPMLKKAEEKELKELEEELVTTDIVSPVEGQAVALSEVNDGVFSEKIMGDGVAIIPEKGVVTAPADGTVMIFPTRHAIGLTTEDGTEILIHIGMDTVNLNGKYYEQKVENGAKVRKGDVLMKFDIDAIQKAGYPVITPVIVTNLQEKRKVRKARAGHVCEGELLYQVSV